MKNIASTRSARTFTYNYKTFEHGINTVKNDNILEPNTAKMCYNFEFKNGNLQTGYGIEFFKVVNGNFGVEGDNNQFYTVNLPANFHPIRAFHYQYYVNGMPKNKIVLISLEKTVLLLDIPNYKQGALESYTLNLSIDEFPNNAQNYRLGDKDVLILTFDNDNMHILDASLDDEQKLKKIENAPKISSMCIHYERLFAIVADQKNRVYFSKLLDPTAWDVSLDGAGYIEMVDERGALTRVVDFKGYVYIFREYGIARLSAYADQTEFSVTQLYTTSGRIYENTVTVCGDKILFLAEDGLYVFDGSNTHHIDMDVENLIDTSKYKYARAAFYKGKYFLACNLKYNDNEKIDAENYSNELYNNSLIVIDLNKSNLTLYRGIDISFLSVINETDYSQLLCCHNGFRNGFLGQLSEGNGSIYNWTMKKKWQSSKCTFNIPEKIKILKKLEIKVSSDVTLKIETDIETKTIKLSPSEKWQTLKPLVKGKEFTFSFESDEAQVEICPPKLTFSTL